MGIGEMGDGVGTVATPTRIPTKSVTDKTHFKMRSGLLSSSVCWLLFSDLPSSHLRSTSSPPRPFSFLSWSLSLCLSAAFSPPHFPVSGRSLSGLFPSFSSLLPLRDEGVEAAAHPDVAEHVRVQGELELRSAAAAAPRLPAAAQAREFEITKTCKAVRE